MCEGRLTGELEAVSYTHLDVYKRQAEDGTFDVLPKKEVIALKKEWEKLEKNLGGIKEMKKIPDAIFVVDPKKERICVQEEMCIRDRCLPCRGELRIR